MKYIDILPLSTVSDSIILGRIEWKFDPFSLIEDVTVQPPPLCGPNNITNTSVIVMLETSGSYNISIEQRTCSQKITSAFSSDCPLLLNDSVMKFTIHSNGSMTALIMSNHSELFTCVNHAWPDTNEKCKNDNS